MDLLWMNETPSEKETESICPIAKDALETAVAELASSRTREGRKISEMLEQRCVDIESIVRSVSQRLPEVLAEMRKAESTPPSANGSLITSRPWPNR